jgi:hypothetical protein
MATALLAILAILKEILSLLWNEAAKPVKATVAPAVPASLRAAWNKRMLDKWKKSSLHSDE